MLENIYILKILMFPSIHRFTIKPEGVQDFQDRKCQFQRNRKNDRYLFIAFFTHLQQFEVARWR